MQQKSGRQAARQRAKLRQLRLEQHEQQKKEARLQKTLPMWGRMVIAVVVVLLLSLVLFRVDTFQVEGNVRYTQEEVADASGITLGDVLLGVNKTRAASKILTGLPYVQQVVISKALPGTVRVTVQECVAVGAAQSESGSEWIFNREGKLLERTEEGNYPTIMGPKLVLPTAGSQVAFDDPDLGSLAMETLEAVLEAGLEEKIQEIHVASLEEVTLTYQNRLEVQLGDGEDLSYKLSYLQQVLGELEESARGVLDLTFATGDQAVFHPLG
jgi:cell division protein FtsQ